MQQLCGKTERVGCFCPCEWVPGGGPWEAVPASRRPRAVGDDGSPGLPCLRSYGFRSKPQGRSRRLGAQTCHHCVRKGQALPRMQWLVLECLWSLSRNSASGCHIVEVWSFMAAIKTFQMHYIISTHTESSAHCLRREASDLSDALVDYRGCLPPRPPAWDSPRLSHSHLAKQHNGLKVCLVLWLPFITWRWQTFCC